uniref:glucuronosyltransferase n=1 Tax=Panagrellus redivivus TaxID=6233 RepID=A0A7E4W7F8_PANRE
MAEVTVDAPHPSSKGKVLLYIATVGYSHIQYAYTIGEWLVKDGFEVHVLMQKITPEAEFKTPKCFTKYFTIEASGKTAPNYLSKLSAGANNLVTSGFYEQVNGIRADVARNFLKNLNYDEIKRENYGMVVSECLSLIAIAAFQQMGIKKFIYTTALPFNSLHADNIGLPSPSSYLPIMDETLPCGDEMGFLDRARNLYTTLYHDWYIMPKYSKFETQMFLEMGLDPKVARNNAKKAFDLRVFNSNILLEYPRPTTYNILHIGGSMTRKPEKLTGDIAPVFKKASDGVILISFGTIAESSDFPKAFRPSVLATMKALPTYEFIFRVGKIEDHPEFKELPNVTLVKWMDQVSILAHPKTKLFYTHCGLNSLNESLTFGVPLVATPIFGDQHYNASILRKKNVGIIVDLLTISPANLVYAFKTVLNDAKYAKQAQQIAQKTKDLPVQPKETLLRWVNYIHIHGAAEDFTLKSATMSYMEVHNLDIIFTVIIAFVLALFLSREAFAKVLSLFA